ncbi:MAG: ArsC/Spx/MgsR family protein [Pseudomonadota bacterium]
MMRKTDKLFAELGLSCDMSESDLLTAMSDNPALIERPLAITEGRAVIGRPPEVLLDLL